MMRINGLYPVKELQERVPPEWRKVREFQEIWKVEDEVIATLRDAVKGRLEQQFVMTATEDGLSRFESSFGILPKATDTLDDRRYRVLTYMMIDTPYTERSILSALEKLCGEGNVSVDVDVESFIVTVRVGLVARESFVDTERMLQKVIPCNMILDLSIKYNRHELFTGFTHQQLSAFSHYDLRNDTQFAEG